MGVGSSVDRIVDSSCKGLLFLPRLVYGGMMRGADNLRINIRLTEVTWSLGGKQRHKAFMAFADTRNWKHNSEPRYPRVVLAKASRRLSMNAALKTHEEDSDRPAGTDITSAEALRVDHSHYPQQGSQHPCTRTHISEDWASVHTIA
ncbi:hypothetical protein PABG_11382 [Paracoccidioides brasiliensis Pb03]|nr:hypothetical protein PABG_11382 [Paracoccidioides brasiliensis Pb03]